MTGDEWGVFRGTGRITSPVPVLPPVPRWRQFEGEGAREVPAGLPDQDRDRAELHDSRTVQLVNAAISLRRPLLVTGSPGSGKSTLAKLVARELSLGPALHWPITSSTRLKNGLYEYDAVGRVHDDNVRWNQVRGRSTDLADEPQAEPDSSDIGRYLRLGPLGTALLPWTRPRVLLIDEIDKSDIDLPNDLLHVFEDGCFTIPELLRLPDGHGPVSVWTADRDGRPATIDRGEVHCKEFPIVLLTSNEERSFPPAFLRRCLRLDLGTLDAIQLRAIVENQIAGAVEIETLLRRFTEDQKSHVLAADQLLNAVFVLSSGRPPVGAARDELLDELLKNLAQ